MQVVGDRAGMLNKFMVDYLNESFHLSTHLSALARVFFMAAGMLALDNSPQLFAVNCCTCLLSTPAVNSGVLLEKALSCHATLSGSPRLVSHKACHFRLSTNRCGRARPDLWALAHGA